MGLYLEDLVPQQTERLCSVGLASLELGDSDGLHHVLSLPVLVQCEPNLRAVTPRHQSHLPHKQHAQG